MPSFRTRAWALARIGFMTGGALLGTTVRAAALEVVRLGGVASDDMTPIVYGQKSGIFARAGLDVQLSRMPNGASVAAGVLSASFDFGKATMSTLFEAHERGVPFTCVTPSIVYDAKLPYAAFIMAKDATFATGKDFNNQLIAVSGLGDIGSLGLRAWVEQHGGDPKSLRFVEVPLSAAAAAIEEHRVAAAETSQPAFGAAMEGGKVRALQALDAIAPTFLLAAWFTTAAFSAKHPDVVRAYCRAWADSATYTNAHRAETAAMMAEFTGVPLALVQRMTRAVAGITLVPAQIQPVIDAAVRYGVIKQGFPAREIIDANALVG
jgi:NitT/TauT family transport system substrate-binding protein